MKLFSIALFLGGIISTSYVLSVPQKSIGTLYRWKQMDFVFPNEDERKTAIENGQYIQSNVIPLGVERWKNRVFVSTPRWKKGIPASLSVLPVVAEETSPPLTPYPSWDWHTAEKKIHTYVPFWGMDQRHYQCVIVGKFPIPEEFVLQDSLITNIIIDSRDPQCKDLHVYISDVRRYGLIVFRGADGVFWKFNHYTFYPEPLLSNYTLHGVNFQWPDGLFGMSLGPYHLGDRPLYYHSMSGSHEFVVYTSVIRDPARVDNSVGEFKLLGESRGPIGQVSAAAVDRNGIMFFNLVSQDSIGCWDTRKEYKIENLGVVAKNNKTLVFPNDLRIDHEVPQVGWIITNRLPMYQFNLLNPNEYNFRVMFLDPIPAIANTVCQY